MKQLGRILIISLLIAATGRASDLPDFPFVAAHGQAEVEVPPNLALVSFELVAFDQEPTNAMAVVRNISRELVTALKGLGITEEQIVAFEVQKRAERERKDYVELNILGYTVTRRFSVTVNDLKQYEPLAKQLLAMDHVVELHSDFNVKERKALEQELLSKACADAKQSAELLAQGFGAEIDGVFAMAQHGFNDLGDRLGLGYSGYGGLGSMSASDAMDEDILLIPSVIKVRNYVSVIYRIKSQ